MATALLRCTMIIVHRPCEVVALPSYLVSESTLY